MGSGSPCVADLGITYTRELEIKDKKIPGSDDTAFALLSEILV